MWTKLTGFLRDFRTLAWPYWVSEDRWRAWGLAAVVAVLAAAQVKILVMFNDWYAEFFNALQNYDVAAFWSLCLKFIWMIAAPFVAVSVYQVYWRQMLEIRWRRWLT